MNHSQNFNSQRGDDGENKFNVFLSELVEFMDPEGLSEGESDTLEIGLTIFYQYMTSI